MAKEIQLQSTITCPVCGYQKAETMPVDACQYFYVCEGCQAHLNPSPAIAAFFAVTVR